MQELLGGAMGGGSPGAQILAPWTAWWWGGISGLCAALALETEHGEAAPRWW